MWNQTTSRYIENINKRRKEISFDLIKDAADIYGIDLKTKFDENDDEFKNFAFNIARKLNKGVTQHTSYTATVSRIADYLGKDYKVYVGFCAPYDAKEYKKAVDKFNDDKKVGIEHPMMATHSFVVVGDEYYEYYNERFSGIDHIDVMEVTVEPA